MAAQAGGRVRDRLVIAAALAVAAGAVADEIARQVIDRHLNYSAVDLLTLATAALCVLAGFGLRPLESSRNTHAAAARVVSWAFAAMFVLAIGSAAAAAFFGATSLPLWPGVNLGVPLALTAAAVAWIAWRDRRNPVTPLPLPLAAFAIAVLFALPADGPWHLLVVAGTVAWNVLTDIDLVTLVPAALIVAAATILLSVPEAARGRIEAPVIAAGALAIAVGIPAKDVVLAAGTTGTAALAFAGVRAALPGVAASHSRTGYLVALAAAVGAGTALVWRGWALPTGGVALAFAAVAVLIATCRRGRVGTLAATAHAGGRIVGLTAFAAIVAAYWNLSFFATLARAGVGSADMGSSIALAVAIGAAVLGLSWWLGALSGAVLVTPFVYGWLDQGALEPLWFWAALVLACGLGGAIRGTGWRAACPAAAGIGVLLIVIATFGGKALTKRPVLWQTAAPAAAEPPPVPAGRWTPMATSGQWRTHSEHGGSVYFPPSGKILFFGADTHFRDWDNAVYAFDPRNGHWRRDYRAAPRYALRTDGQGNRISGVKRLLPWPMHVYDGMAYVESLGEIAVVGSPLHILRAVPGERYDPTWFYDPRARRWRIRAATGGGVPQPFSSVAAHDRRDDTLYYMNGIRDPFLHLPIGTESTFLKAILMALPLSGRDWTERRHAPLRLYRGSPSGLFDPARHLYALFRGSAYSSVLYMLDPRSGILRRTRELTCGGVLPTTVNLRYPAARDAKRGTYLFLPALGGPGHLTCVYDPDSDTVRHVAGAQTPPFTMGFSLHYIPELDRFLLFTGHPIRTRPATVHMFRIGR